MRRRVEVTAGMALLVLVLTACGGDDDDDGSTSLEVTTTEFAFEPDSWTVPAGEDVAIELENEGTLEHEWVVIEQGEEIATEADFTEEAVLFEVEAVPAGESGAGTFTITEAGRHQVICAVPGHFSSGMEGTLTVE
jgi:uncharacterized cupredoxin-like copper-binding protein